jgi:hypothetical protein
MRNAEKAENQQKRRMKHETQKEGNPHAPFKT